MTQKNLLLYEMKHHLLDAKNLSNAGLASVTEKDLEDYKKEYEDCLLAAYSTDRQTALELSRTLRENTKIIFGSGSKEDKYVDRSLNSYARVSDHYQQYPSLTELEHLVNNAKEQMKSLEKVSTGVDTKTMDDVDEAIKYLIEKGFVYGTDFSSHNAVDIAMSLSPQDIKDESDFLGIKCSCEAYNHTIAEDIVKCSCSCGHTSKRNTIAFKDGKVCLKETVNE